MAPWMVKIERAFGHFEVYVDGEFFCTADTFDEAVKELEKEGLI